MGALSSDCASFDSDGKEQNALPLTEQIGRRCESPESGVTKESDIESTLVFAQSAEHTTTMQNQESLGLQPGRIRGISLGLGGQRLGAHDQGIERGAPRTNARPFGIRHRNDQSTREAAITLPPSQLLQIRRRLVLVRSSDNHAVECSCFGHLPPISALINSCH